MFMTTSISARLKVIDKPLNNLYTIQGVAERKIATCLITPMADEFCNLVEQPVELSKLFDQRRKSPIPRNFKRITKMISN